MEALGQALEAEFPPIHIETEHHLHAGMYSRTVYVPKGAAVVGLTVKVPTQLICCGHFRITDGGITRSFAASISSTAWRGEEPLSMPLKTRPSPCASRRMRRLWRRPKTNLLMSPIGS